MADTSVKLMPATVGHRRHWPKKNSFVYSVYYVVLPVNEADDLSSPSLFSKNRFNILSVKTKDHGFKNEQSWHSFISQELKKAKITLDDNDSIDLICHPRLFGYAFNPISYWRVRNNKGELKAVLCEVNNTFGDSHNYLLAKKDGSIITESDTMLAQKKLYVSPFNTMAGGYEFRFKNSGTHFESEIKYFDDERHILDAWIGGDYVDLTSTNTLKSVVLYPFMTLKVVLAIHYQAVRLWLKKVPHTLKKRPKPYESGKTTSSKKTKD